MIHLLLKLKCIVTFTVLIPVLAAGAPKIIFISENRTAEEAVRATVVREYNAAQREALRETDFEAWKAYESVDWRDIPVDFRDARASELLDQLGLMPDDPADKGFTDFLEGLGYDVVRSWTERDEDPITGAVTVTHEFWGSAESDDPTRDFFLSESQLDRLSGANLIIMSPDNTPNPYSWSGRENGSSSTILIEQWNGLEVPILSLNARLIQTNEWGSWAWGWGYGFTQSRMANAAFDRQEQTPAELNRFVFPDWRPKVLRPESELLRGLEPEDGDRLSLYKEHELFPVLPRTPVKFSNNPNFEYPENVQVVLELDVPSFFAAGIEIPTRDPVILDIEKGVRFFDPTDMQPERVGTPAERRVYFAAGMGGTGLYNLSVTGEQIFLNVIEDLAGESPGLPPVVPVGTVLNLDATGANSVSVMTQPGLTYALWRSSDLEDWGEAPVGQLSGDGTVRTLNDESGLPPVEQGSPVFYRVEIVEP